MREIQFEYIFENIRYGGIHKEVYSLIDIENGCPIEFVDDNKEYRLKWRRRYTGLRDRNYVKIYKGDLVKTSKYNKTLDGNIGIVGFIQGCFCLECPEFESNQFVPLCKFGLREDSLEVIGNIYEHPELLHVKE